MTSIIVSEVRRIGFSWFLLGALLLGIDVRPILAPVQPCCRINDMMCTERRLQVRVCQPYKPGIMNRSEVGQSLGGTFADIKIIYIGVATSNVPVNIKNTAAHTLGTVGLDEIKFNYATILGIHRIDTKMYLLDGSFVCGILPYVEYDSVMKHPLWGSNLLFNNEEAIVKCHRDYIRAGAEFLTTNTYQASIEGFQKYLDLNYDQSFKLIKKSVTICRRAIMEESSERTVRIMGSVGPYGASLCDGSEYNGNYIGKINSKELYDWHKPRIQALVEVGVDVLLFETIPSTVEADILLSILAEYPNQKACLSFSCKDSKHISDGETFESAVEKFWSNDSRKQLIAIGMNCLDPRLITPLLTSVKTENVDFIIYPNGGGVWDAIRKCWDNTQMYQVSIDDLNLWSKKGLKIIGGCCNTDATEISRFRNLIDNLPS